MGRIYRRSETGPYWGDYTDTSGKRFQRSLRTLDRAVAKERLRAAELASTPQARGRRQRLSEAIDHVIGLMHDKAEGTREMYRDKGRRLATTFGDPYINDITRDMISAYITRRLSGEIGHGGAAPHTVQKELITLRRALREAHERGILPVMPSIPRFSPRYQPREVWLTPIQFECVCAELEADRRLWASLAALAGGSAGEVERLEWPNIDLGADRMLLPGTKRETRRRRVPIAPALRYRLIQVPEKQRTGKVVAIWNNVRRDLHLAVARANLKIAAQALADDRPFVPIPKISPNDLRRTFASWLVQNGAPLLTVATLMGHSSTRMVEKVYGKLSEANLDAAMASVPAFGAVTPVQVEAPALTLLPPTTCTNDGDSDQG